MSNSYNVEVTDTFGGEANYCWVNRYVVTMPELTHYGYDGSTNYGKANKIANRELVKAAKAEAGWTGLRCRSYNHGDMIELRPYGMCQVMFINYAKD